MAKLKLKNVQKIFENRLKVREDIVEYALENGHGKNNPIPQINEENFWQRGPSRKCLTTEQWNDLYNIARLRSGD
jgi:uncharacterized Fe-S cluster-containing radical SAM superfamily enzyme